MALRIGLLGNAQMNGIAACLRAVLPGAQITPFDVTSVLSRPASLQAAHTTLSGCDHLLVQSLPDEWRTRIGAVLPAGAPFHTVPVVDFAGFHPDCIRIETSSGPLESPTGEWHSRIAVVAYLAGCSLLETIALFNRLVFVKLGYLDAYANESARLEAVFSAQNLDLAPLQAAWISRGCFMHAPDRPKIHVLMDIARIALTSMNITFSDNPLQPLPDPFALAESAPVFPNIAAVAGVPPEGAYRPASANTPGRPIALRDFVARSFRLYDSADPARLAAASNVATALAALNLKASRATPQRGASHAFALLTCHGTIVREPEPPASPRHLPLTMSLQEFPALILERPATGQRHGFPSPLLGGFRVIPSGADALIAMEREGRIFCPERDSTGADFTRNNIGEWEKLLPIAQANLEALADLFSYHWRVQATGESVEQASIRVATGFSLWFGRYRIDLRTDPPRAEPAHADGRKRVRFSVAGESLVAVATARLAQSVTPVPVPAPVTLALGQRQLISGAPTLLSLPMTGSSADRRWLYETYAGPLPIPVGNFHHGRLLCRVPGVKLRFDESGGVHPVAGDTEIDAAAILSGTSILAAPPATSWQLGWIEASLRLFALWPFLPDSAKLLVPPGGLPNAVAAVWQELGLARESVATPFALCLAQDLIWLGQESAALLPAETLSAFRDQAQAVAAPPEQQRRIFVHGIGRETSGATLQAMADGGFELLDLAGVSPLAQLSAFAEAAWVVGRTGPDLAGIAFCAKGTRIIELAEAERFVPDAWMIAGKIGLNPAVLPCGGEVDLERFEALGNMLANREE
jgi:hypothetical protein